MSAHAFGPDDIYLRAFDKEGRPLGQLTLDKVSTATESIVAFRDKGAPSQQFLVRIDEDELTNAYRTLLRTASNAGLEIYNVVCFIPRGHSTLGTTVAVHDAKLADGSNSAALVGRGARKADLAHATAHFSPDAHQHLNKASNQFRVDLVDDDQGDPQYAKLTSSSAAMDVAASGGPDDGQTNNMGTGTPGVVSIMGIVDRAGFIEDGPFQVRIILTEEPKGGLTEDKIIVKNGSATSVVKGATYKGGHNAQTVSVSMPQLHSVTANSDLRWLRTITQ